MPKTCYKFIKEEKKEIKKLEEKCFKNEELSFEELKEKGKKQKINNLKEVKIIMKQKNILPLIKKSKTTINIFYNEKEKQIEKMNDKNDFNNYIDSNNQNNIKDFIPSGSNFNLMNLEVGVSLKEEDKYKSGGKDFYSKYKKYSIFDFDNKYKEDLETNTLKLNKKYDKLNIEVINDSSAKDISQTQNNIKTLLISPEKPNEFLDNTYLKYKTNIYSNSLSNNTSSKLNHYLENKTLTLTKSISNINGSIDNNETNKPIKYLLNISTSLNDKFNPINDDVKNKKNLFKRKNIFRFSPNIRPLKNKFSLKFINDFNKALLTKKNLEFYNKNNLFHLSISPEKPSTNQIYKEIGYKKSISRNRSKILSLKKPIALTTLEFFKN